MGFKQRYPLSTNALLLAPVVLRENVPWLSRAPFVSARGMLAIAEYCRRGPGAVRTALSRLRASGSLESFADAQGVTRFRMSTLSRSVSHAVQGRFKRPCGFVIAVFSFATEHARERHIVRSTLAHHGFQKLAQNVYVNGEMDTTELEEVIRQHRFSERLFLFRCPDVQTPALREKLSSVFDLPRRARVLLRLEEDLKAFLEERQLSQDELARRCIYAGPVHYQITYADEPPLPASYLPPDYPLERVSAYLGSAIERHAAALLEYYRRTNS